MTTGITDRVLENKTLACFLRAMIFKQTFSCLWSGIQSMDFVGSDPLMILGCRFQCFLALMRCPSHYSPRASWHFLLFLHQSYSSFYFTRIDPLNWSIITGTGNRISLMPDRPITEPRSIPQTGILEEKCRENTILTYHLSPQSPPQLFKAPYLFNFIYFS